MRSVSSAISPWGSAIPRSNHTVEPHAEPSHYPAQMILPPVEGREGARMGMPHASGRAVALVMRIAHVSAKVVDKPAGR